MNYNKVAEEDQLERMLENSTITKQDVSAFQVCAGNCDDGCNGCSPETVAWNLL